MMKVHLIIRSHIAFYDSKDQTQFTRRLQKMVDSKYEVVLPLNLLQMDTGITVGSSHIPVPSGLVGKSFD
jgi:hypothetical protein